MGLFDIFRSKKELLLMAELESLKRKQDITRLVSQFIEDNPGAVMEDAENMPYARVFENGERFEYEIFVNGNVSIKQDFDPYAEGFVPMTEEYATSISNEIVNGMREQYGSNE